MNELTNATNRQKKKTENRWQEKKQMMARKKSSKTEQTYKHIRGKRNASMMLKKDSYVEMV